MQSLNKFFLIGQMLSSGYHKKGDDKCSKWHPSNSITINEILLGKKENGLYFIVFNNCAKFDKTNMIFSQVIIWKTDRLTHTCQYKWIVLHNTLPLNVVSEKYIKKMITECFINCIFFTIRQYFFSVSH